MSDKIWALLVNSKFKEFQIVLLVKKYQKQDRNINIFLALASSASVGAWAIWSKFPLLWSAIIVASQILTTVKPFFPFNKYVKELNAKSLQLANLNLSFEKLFHKCQTDSIDETTAEQMYFDLKEKYNNILSFGDELIIEPSQKIQDEATERTDIYLRNEYKIDINQTSKK